MIIAFAAISLLCAVIALATKDAQVRWIFLGFLALNIAAGAVAVLEGDAWKFLPGDNSEPLYRR